MSATPRWITRTVGSAKNRKMICTRIGVFRMISTYTPPNWLSTGVRYARIAPSTRPIAVAMTIPIAETWIVRQSPSASRPRLSQIADHSKLASTLIQRAGAAARRRPPPRQSCLRARAVGRQVLADGVGEERLPLARHVVVEGRPELLRHVRVQDRSELVAVLHVLQRRVHPLACRLVALADADAPGDVQELVVRELERVVERRDADDERVVEHERRRATLLHGCHGCRGAVDLEQCRVLEAVAHPRRVDRPTRRDDGLPG